MKYSHKKARRPSPLSINAIIYLLLGEEFRNLPLIKAEEKLNDFNNFPLRL